MQLKIKKLSPEAIIPKYATPGAAAFDLHAIGLPPEGVTVSVGTPIAFHTGLAVEVPEGHVMLINSRSGHGFKHYVHLVNSQGVIDSDYRGELMVKLASGEQSLHVSNGDRIAQAMIVPCPQVELVVVDDLSETERGTGGFGSTGST